MMRINRRIRILTGVFFVCMLPFITGAGSDTKVSQAERMWKNSVEYGRELFTGTKLGTNGKSCSNAGCHKDGSRLVGIGKEYPKFVKMDNRVVTLGHMINYCIFGAIKGKMLDLDSTKLIALQAYISVLK